MQQRKKAFKLLTICMMLMFSMLFTSVLAKAEQAKPELSVSEITIGIGTYGRGFIYNKTDDKYAISVKNPLEDAQYSFTSSNKDIVTVKKSGSKAYLTGVKKGTVYITCKQTLDGQTTTLGKCKVIVKNATLKPTKQVSGLVLGSGKFGSWVAEPLCYIENRIPDAKYTYTTNSKNFTLKDEKYNETQAGEGYFGFKQAYTAKKSGTYTVTVKETYKGKTKKIGTFKVIVHDLEIPENYPMEPNASIYYDDIIRYSRYDKEYFIEGDGFDARKKTSNSVVYIEENWYGAPRIYSLKDGTATLKIYEGTNESNKKYIGSCTIKVTSDYIAFSNKHYQSTVGYKNEIFFRTGSETTLDDIKITSSDESILTVKFSGEYKSFNIIPHKAGTVTITAKKGKEKISCTVTVYASAEARQKAMGYY